jgi:hypothetical protein
VVRDHGFLERIEMRHCPPRFAQQGAAVLAAHRVGRTLGSILRARNEPALTR